MISTDSGLIGPWVAKKVRGVWHPDGSTCIGNVVEGQIRAGVWFEAYNGASITGHIAIEPHGLTKTFLFAILHYPFVVCGVNKIIAPVGPENEPSQSFCRKLGFRLEATLSDAHPHGDLLLYTLRRADCKYLEMNHG